MQYCNLFNEDYYRLIHVSNRFAKSDLAAFYASSGWKNLDNPSSDFNTKYYISSHPEIIRSGLDPLAWHLRHGQRFATFPSTAPNIVALPHIRAHLLDVIYYKAFMLGLFDLDHYLGTYADIRGDDIIPLRHYRKFGWKEGRRPSQLFDAEWYMRAYLSDRHMEPLLHYMTIGRNKGCQTRPGRLFPGGKGGKGEEDAAYEEGVRLGMFDADFYYEKYPDVREAGVDALAHFRSRGWRELRDPSAYFDYAWYLNTWLKGDVSQNALLQYINHGRFLKYAPKAYDKGQLREMAVKDELFDEDFYLRHNEDIRIAGADAFSHYMEYGWRESRNPSVKLDLSWYVFEYMGGLFSENPLVHYLTVGKATGNRTRPDPNRPLNASDACPGSPKKRICLFVGYDRKNIIHEYVMEYIRELAKYADVYYLADNDMEAEELGKLKGLVKGAWATRQPNHDFGAWGVLAEKFVGWATVEKYDEALLVNDSCFLLKSLEPIFAEMDARKCDWWGLQATLINSSIFTDVHSMPPIEMEEAKGIWLSAFNREETPAFHISSYFLAFRATVIRDKKFQAILANSARNINFRKDRLIKNYEIGLSYWLISRGYNFETYARRLYFGKQPVYAPVPYAELLRDGFPLLKIGLVRDNNFKLLPYEKWREEIFTYGEVKFTDAIDKYINNVFFADQFYCNWHHDLKLSKDDFVKNDKNYPKYNNWWAFPVCSETFRLDDNSRCLFEFVKNNPKIKKIILTREKFVTDIDGVNVHVYPLFSEEGQYYLARSKNIFLKQGVDANIAYDLSPELHNFYRLWHGIPLKLICSVSNEAVGNERLILEERKEQLKTRAVIAASETDRLAMAVAHPNMPFNNVWLTGLPRHDFINCAYEDLPAWAREDSRRLEATLGARRLVLFAPTFRSPGRGRAYRFSEDEVVSLREVLRKHNAVMGVREHMADREGVYGKVLSGEEFVSLSTEHFPNTELILRRADMLITDYSSIFIDFMQTKRAVLCFAHDYDAYMKNRGFFYDLEWCFPGRVCRTFLSLLAELDLNLNGQDLLTKQEYAYKSRFFMKYNDSDNCRRVYEKVVANYTPDITALPSGTRYFLEDRKILGVMDLWTPRVGEYHLRNIADALASLGWHLEIRKLDELQARDFAGVSALVLAQTRTTARMRDFCREFQLGGGKVLAITDNNLFDGASSYAYRFKNVHDKRCYRNWDQAILAARSFAFADAILANSEALAAELVEASFYAACIRSSLSPQILDKRPRERNVYGRNLKILCYGHATRYADNALVCMEPLLRLKAAFPGVEIRICSDPCVTLDPHFASGEFILEAMAEDKDLHAALDRTDLLLLPVEDAPYNLLPDPIVVALAALHGVPVLASPVPPFKEIIRDGVNGTFAASPGGWFDAMSLIIAQPHLIREYGEKAHRHIVPKFLPGANARELVDIISRLYGENIHGSY